MRPTDLLDHFDHGTSWPAGPRATTGDDVAAAYRDALAVRALRVARGEQPVGYKIGFTNRTIWDRYGVHAPIWGTVWDTSLAACDGDGTIDLARTCEPRIEPEIVFGIESTPPADVSLAALFEHVDWLAPGFEIVDSHRPAWKFDAADAVADGSLHARLLVGPRTPVRHVADSGAALDARLAAARVRLLRDGAVVDEGRGAGVLDGPLHALLHFVCELRRCPGAPALAAGDVVTTGTWTDAWPVATGQAWRAEFDAPFGALGVRFV